ncbi:porin [Bacteroides sp.]
MRKTLCFILIFLFPVCLTAQEKLGGIVNTLKERITLSAYAQLGYTYNSAADPSNSFDIKRIIFMADGKITERWSCYFMYDFAVSSLQELYTDYQFLPGLSVRLGQFKTPYTMENLLSPTSVELINCYSLPACYLVGINGSDALCSASGGRDIGLMVYGDLFKKLVTYKVALMNGQGINTRDRNSQKDVVGYLSVDPLKWLTVGTSFVIGKGHSVSETPVHGIEPGENYRRNRWSIGAFLTGEKASLRTEFMTGKDAGMKSNGGYATGCVQIVRNIDVVASYEYLNRNVTMGDKQSNYMAGLQYWFYPKCRLQVQYTHLEPKQGEGSDLLQAQVQVRF